MISLHICTQARGSMHTHTPQSGRRSPFLTFPTSFVNYVLCIYYGLLSNPRLENSHSFTSIFGRYWVVLIYCPQHFNAAYIVPHLQKHHTLLPGFITQPTDCYFSKDLVSTFVFSINSSKNNYQNNLHINNHVYQGKT